ncbi:MAG TPA: hypothetical protein VE959_32125 [Bryobacteraceae bacterium]|nr:hypothetical protein [Bryobacteraceae bacterium]
MSPSRLIDSLRAFLSLEARVCEARLVLQETSDFHPDFERRVERLVRLVDERDQALWPAPARREQVND